ncbi:GNAT family N-acetyltransferase [Paenibacillus agri]|uniref:GNAT family N-acetyltransferase n=1 Tax=Paenibacillus agri TaxID=2744309 RepID=A0A850EQ71_9BACL|nr:GNAT family N-acetyltransferase [Paenibacillus agri]NUU63368.1 GNAT family N-acetyltransferase [Paenibacillus agri]
MFEHFLAGDGVLLGEAFVRDEVKFNLIHMITGFEGNVRLKTPENTLVLAYSQGFRPWLWISYEVSHSEKETLIQELAEHLKDEELPGIISEPDIARRFAEVFCQGKGTSFHTHLMLEVYHCPAVHKPINVEGHVVQASIEDAPLIAKFLAGFSEDAFGKPVDPKDMLSTAEGDAASGQMYLWVVDGTPVSMAKIAHRSPRHARINDVYTPRDQRKKGYASAIVAAICERVLEERLIPMLYADGHNPAANKVYQSIGFVNAGRMNDLKFD